MTNLRGPVPPAFTDPFPAMNDTVLEVLVFVENIRSTETKYVEERVIVKAMDGFTR